MLNLHSIHPSVAEEFESGNLVVKNTHRAFSSIAIDHAHEQNNRLVKDDFNMHWMVAGPEKARLIGEFEDSVESIKHKTSRTSKGCASNIHQAGGLSLPYN